MAQGKVSQSTTVESSGMEDTIPKEMFDRPEEFDKRRNAQVPTPAFPTTTIGSFPQTVEIRQARMKFKKGLISEEEYKGQMRMHIAYAIGVQDGLGLDILVHGEAERTDM